MNDFGMSDGSRWSTRVATAAGLMLLTACLVLGGGTRQALPVESLLQLIALPVLLLALFVRSDIKWGARAWLCLAVVAGAVALMLAQLVPLPWGVWSGLAGRTELAEALQLAAVDTQSRPLSLSPSATWRALLAWLPPVALLLLASRLPLAQRIVFLQWTLVLGIAACMLGFAQLAGGSQSALRWHEVTSATNAVGPFANRNHLATLLAVCLPLCAAWLMVGYRYQRPGRRTALAMFAVLVGVLLIVGLSVTRSRAGVLLGIAALFGIAAMAWLYRSRLNERDRRDRRLRRLLMLGAAVGLAASLQYGLLDLWRRLNTDTLEDHRWVVATTTIDAIRHFGVFGAGAGTFVEAYPAVEPPMQRGEYYVNRAHNDWLEWTLEGGLPVVPLLLLAIFAVGRLTLDAVRCESRRAPWRWAAALGLGLFMLHSLIDYPLRTTALAALAAVFVACLLPDVADARATRQPIERPPPRPIRRKRTAVSDPVDERLVPEPVPVPQAPPGPLPDDDEWGAPPSQAIQNQRKEDT